MIKVDSWVNEWLLFNANSAIFQLYHCENKIIFNELMNDEIRFVLEQHANTNFIVFGLTRPGLEPTIYRSRGEHTNHYNTDAVVDSW